MSFWPFTNSLNSNNALSKYLDSIQDLQSVSVSDLISDPTLSQELVNELHNVKNNYNQKNGTTSFTFSNIQNDTDSASLSSNNEPVNNTKDSKGTKLIELLIQPHILNGLIEVLENSVDYFKEQAIKEEEELRRMIEEDEPSTDIQEEEEIEDKKESFDDKIKRQVQAAADILSIDLWIISNRIIETETIMSKLWQLIKLDLTENSPTVSYLVHILDQLMDTNSIELLNFIRRQHDLVDTFLDKIEVPMLMDYFFRIIQTDKPDSPTGIIETISSQNIIIKLINILKPQQNQFEHENYIPNHQLFFKQTAATDFLKALVTISSNTALAVVLETNIGPNQLTRELVSPEIINIIINEIMLVKVNINGKVQTNKHGINNCVSVIIELIRKNNSDYDLNCGTYSSMLNNDQEVNSFVMYKYLKDFEQNPPGPRDPIYLGDMLKIFSENLPKFQELLEIEPIPPPNASNILGFTRFKVSELIAELLHCSNMILLNSRKIKKIINVRDQVRFQKEKQLCKALNEAITFPDINEVTSGLDDVSLDDIHFKQPSNIEEDDSEDEEPSISTDNPFVCKERDDAIRSDPCVGDYFKIKLIDTTILKYLLSFFFQFQFNNFYHNVVFDIIQQIFNGKLNSYNSFLIVELFKLKLTTLIVDNYEQEPISQAGYRGHLILISEEVVKFTSLYKPDLISGIILQYINGKDWSNFIENYLLKTREIYNAILGSSNDDEFDENGEQEPDTEQPQKIILGDSSNHDQFINDNQQVAEIQVKDMSPSGDLTKHQLDDEDDITDDVDDSPNNYLSGSLSGSSSDEEDDDDDVVDEEECNGNELRRVPMHNE
ncbi:unnamed protein product [Candida verbasci]|uniref:Uncharacterized protein n=1 Tax=Candida verbasci TaxID=1227364 RepID=A0A9W4XER3_9ASCO|nr:unnamed protein product [Candida verbasci]